MKPECRKSEGHTASARFARMVLLFQDNTVAQAKVSQCVVCNTQVIAEPILAIRRARR